MKSLLLGVAFILLIGVGGLVYRNALEHPSRPIACPLDAKMCPDGTSVGRTGLSCVFPACPPPNVTLADIGISYAIPAGYTEAEKYDDNTVVSYETAQSSTEPSSIIIRRYPITASSTALATIQATAIGGASGLPVPVTAFTSVGIGTHRFTVVSIERFEATITVAYYLARGSDVLRFDAIDRGVLGWTDPGLDVNTLPAQKALRHMLGTLQGG